MNNKIKKALFALFISALSATGCITEYKVELSPNDTQVLIVDGCIMENTDAIFLLSRSFSMDKVDVPEESFINYANLTLIGSNGYVSPPAISLGRGKFRIPVEELEDDVEYGIQIVYNGDTYQSMLSKPLRTPEIDSISWKQPEAFGPVYFYVSTHGDATDSKYYTWTCTEEWEIIAQIKTTVFYSVSDNMYYHITPAPFFYCWKKIESENYFGSAESLGENVIINKELYQCISSGERFSSLYSVNVHQRAISKGAYEYYQNIIKMNEEIGSLFAPQPTEFLGNITCITDPAKKAMGYIEVSKNTTQKKIYIYPQELTHRIDFMSCNLVSHAIIRDLGIIESYEKGYRPAGDPNQEYLPESIYPADWSSSYCTDCTAKGGTKNRPDFWPNDHQ